MYALQLSGSGLRANLKGIFSLIINLFQGCFLILVELTHDTRQFKELYLQLYNYRGLKILVQIWEFYKVIIRNYELTTQQYYMRVHLYVNLQKICPIAWTNLQESLGYVIVTGMAYQQQEAILGYIALKSLHSQSSPIASHAKWWAFSRQLTCLPLAFLLLLLTNL